MQCILKNTCKHKVKRISLSLFVPQTPLSLCSDDYWDRPSKWSTVMRWVKKCVFLCVSQDALPLRTKYFICNLRYLIWFYSDQETKTDRYIGLMQIQQWCFLKNPNSIITWISPTEGYSSHTIPLISLLYISISCYIKILYIKFD